MDIYSRRIEKILSVLHPLCYGEKLLPDRVLMCECGYKSGTVSPEESEMLPFPEDGQWGREPDGHAWFRLHFTLPESLKNKSLVLHLDTDRDGWNVFNPQFILYADGKTVAKLFFWPLYLKTILRL
jgi:hypothetical protein